MTCSLSFSWLGSLSCLSILIVLCHYKRSSDLPRDLASYVESKLSRFLILFSLVLEVGHVLSNLGLVDVLLKFAVFLRFIFLIMYFSEYVRVMLLTEKLTLFFIINGMKWVLFNLCRDWQAIKDALSCWITSFQSTVYPSVTNLSCCNVSLRCLDHILILPFLFQSQMLSEAWIRFHIKQILQVLFQ